MLKVLLDSLSNDGKVIQVEVLQTLIDMLKCSDLIESFSSYNELLVLKVIYSYKSDDQKVDSSSGSGGRSPVSIDFIFLINRNYPMLSIYLSGAIHNTKMLFIIIKGPLERGEVCGDNGHGFEARTNYPFSFHYNRYGIVSIKYGCDKNVT